MSNSIELTTKAGVKIAVNAVTGGGGGGGVTAHSALTGLTTGDDHTQYQRSEATYTSSASYTITDESVVITAGSAVTLPGAQAMAGRIVGVGAAAQTVAISPAGTDTMFDDPGNPYSLPSGNGISFVAVQIGGNWGWAIYTRNGPAFDMPKWVGESLAEGKVLRVNSSGAPAWASIAAADVPNLAASKVTSGTFDVARIPTGTTSTTVAIGNDSRFTDARTPTSHASSHASAGSDPLTLDVSQVSGAVPTTRTVNAKALSSNITLTASDVGAVATGDASVTNARVPQWRRLTFSDANYDLSTTPSPAVSGSVVLQQTGTLTAARTVTLPAASACPAGSEVIVNGGAGASGTNTVTIQRAGSDTINGATTSVVIGTAWGQRRFVSDGTSAWAFDDGLLRRSQNLSDLASASTARTNLGLATIASSGSASDLSTGTVPTARLNTLVVGGQGAGSQVNEPSTATSLLTSTVTVPVCAAGDVLLFSAGINFTQNSSVSRSVTFAVKLGSTTILSSIPSITSSATARVMHLQGAIRVGSTTAQSASMILSFSTSASGSTGVVNAATGTATENLASASTLDLLVTATNNTTQNYTLSYLNVTKVAA